MQRSIPNPTIKVYKGPEGVEILREFEMAPVLEPTPAIPYVCDQFQYNCKPITYLCGAGEPSPPWPAKSGTDNSNGDGEI